jgi:hypothetical protein
MFIGVMDLIVGLQILIATMNSVHQVMIQKLLLFALFFNYSPFLTLLFYSIGFFEFYLIFKVVFPLYSIGFSIIHNLSGTGCSSCKWYCFPWQSVEEKLQLVLFS